MSPPSLDASKAIFGSEIRAKLLGALADSRESQTGYFLAEKIDVNPSKVYRQLPRLVKAGILGMQRDESGAKRYALVDEDLRRFLLKRVRVTTTEEWFAPERMREKREAYQRLRGVEVELPRTRPNRAAVSHPEEFERPPEKDRALSRVGR